jgi:hypothetical protein
MRDSAYDLRYLYWHFRGESSGVIGNAILDGVPTPPVSLNPDVPQLEDIVHKALEKDRDLPVNVYQEISIKAWSTAKSRQVWRMISCAGLIR